MLVLCHLSEHFIRLLLFGSLFRLHFQKVVLVGLTVVSSLCDFLEVALQLLFELVGGRIRLLLLVDWLFLHRLTLFGRLAENALSLHILVGELFIAFLCWLIWLFRLEILLCICSINTLKDAAFDVVNLRILHVNFGEHTQKLTFNSVVDKLTILVFLRLDALLLFLLNVVWFFLFHLLAYNYC